MKQVSLVLLLLFYSQVHADTFRLALPEDDYPPFHFANSDNEGILNKILSLFSAETGYIIEKVLASEMRSVKLVRDSKVDARLESKAWQPDSSQYYWSDGIATIEDIIVVSQNGDPASFHSQNESIEGVLLANYGYVFPEYEQLLADQVIRRENFYSDLAILHSLYNNHKNTRFTIMSRAVFNWYRQKFPKFHILNTSHFSVGEEPLQLQFSFTPRGKVRADSFNNFLKKLKANGELARIINSYE